jgi:hypothetical protein
MLSPTFSPLKEGIHEILWKAIGPKSLANTEKHFVDALESSERPLLTAKKKRG